MMARLALPPGRDDVVQKSEPQNAVGFEEPLDLVMTLVKLGGRRHFDAALKTIAWG